MKKNKVLVFSILLSFIISSASYAKQIKYLESPKCQVSVNLSPADFFRLGTQYKQISENYIDKGGFVISIEHLRTNQRQTFCLHPIKAIESMFDRNYFYVEYGHYHGEKIYQITVYQKTSRGLEVVGASAPFSAAFSEPSDCSRDYDKSNEVLDAKISSLVKALPKDCQ